MQDRACGIVKSFLFALDTGSAGKSLPESAAR